MTLERIKADVYTVEEVAQLLKISVDIVYDQIKAGKIPAIHFGRRIIIPRVRFERMLADD